MSETDRIEKVERLLDELRHEMDALVGRVAALEDNQAELATALLAARSAFSWVPILPPRR